MDILDLFADDRPDLAFAPDALLLAGFALPQEKALLAALDAVTAVAPFRTMVMPSGLPMSATKSNCGAWGWVSDRKGYRYMKEDPATGKPWPAMPEIFLSLAREAAQKVGFEGFTPDGCLINGYAPGAKLSLHQDLDERDYGAPVVAISLGLPAVFLFGGMQRSDPTRKVALMHGDIVVWGGQSRLVYHGIAPLKAGVHPVMGELRVSLTFRKVA